MAGGAETSTIAALPAIARLAAPQCAVDRDFFKRLAPLAIA